MTKKIIQIFVLLTFVLQLIPIVHGAESAEANLIFQSSEQTFRCGSNGKIKVGEDGFTSVENGVSGAFLEYEADIKQTGMYHIYATFKKTNKSGIVQFSADEKNAGETIDLYSKTNSVQTLEIGYIDIEKTGSQRVRFTAVNKNQVSLGYEINLKEVVFKKESVEISHTSNRVGNIFVEGEAVDFPITLTNRSRGNVIADIEYSAVSSHGYVKTISESETFRAGEKKQKTISLPIDFKDTYELNVNVCIEETGENYSKSFPFSYIEKINYSEDNIFGVCTHFSQDKGDVKTVAKLMKDAGVKWIRDECGWGAVEKQRKVFAIPEKYMNYVDEMVANDIEVLMILDYGNRLYDEGGAPYTDEGIAAFADYARFMAESFKGKIHTYELWNEYTTGMGNPKKQPPEVYAKMLDAVYKALREVDPEIKLLCGGFLHPSNPAFKRIFDNGGFDKCDAISYHPYCMPQNPDTMDTHGDIESNVFFSNELMRRYGKEKPIWFTEIGWHIGNSDNAITDSQQAAYMIRMYSLGLVNGVEKIFWYDFQDDFADVNHREANFGIIKSFTGLDIPYQAKQSYVAYPAMVNKLGGAEFVKEYRYSNDARAHLYEDRNGNDVVLLYNINGVVEAKAKGDTAMMQAYDMFGNPTTLDKLSAEPIYLVGKKGQFKPKEIETSEFSVLSAACLLYREGDFDGVRNDFKGINIQYRRAFDFKDGQPVWTAGKDVKELSFDIDDTYAMGQILPMELQVTYFDDGNGSFTVKYDSAKGIKETEPVKTTNSGEWKTAVIQIEDGMYSNSVDGADFSIVPEKEVYVRRVKLIKKSGIANDNISVLLSDFMKYENSTVRFGDNPTGFELIERNGRYGYKTNKGLGSLFIYFNINDEMIYDGSYDLEAYVDYFDEGEGHFSIVYQKRDGDQWTVSDAVKLEDTKTWKTACIKLDKAACNNKNANADFRLAVWDPVNGTTKNDIVFGKIEVKQRDESGNNSEKNMFSDIDKHWSCDLVMKMYKSDMIAGYEDNTFLPNNPIAVDEFTAMLLNYLKITIEENDGYWAKGYIDKAIELGILHEGEIEDYSAKITRGQMALMLARAAGGSKLGDLKIYQNDIKDYRQMDEKYKKAVLQVYALGIMHGYDDGNFSPEREATRAEAVVMISAL